MNLGLVRTSRTWNHLALILAILAWTHESPAAEPPNRFPNGPGAFASRVIVPLNDGELAKAIDQSLSARWSKEKVAPAPLSGDAEFLRRVSLDIAGRIPPVSEAREFLENSDPEKRRKLVERLLAGPAYANHMTDVWLDLLLPEAKTSFKSRSSRATFKFGFASSSPTASALTRSFAVC